MAKELTPLMKQYWEIKSAHSDKILFFRMGDFFELFHDDAVTAAPILDIVLTSRNKKSEDDTPMCGVPAHNIAGHVNRLLSHGYKVAICDQVEDPKLAKGLVKRAITRVLSPGMVFDPDGLEGNKPNYIASFDSDFISFIEPTTGEAFSIPTEGSSQTRQTLELLQPVEVLLRSDQSLDNWLGHKTTFDGNEITVPSGFSAGTESSQRLLQYAASMQGDMIFSTLSPFEIRRPKLGLRLTARLQKHLEVFESNTGDHTKSFFHIIDKTKTSAGARLLKRYLLFPLGNKSEIETRQKYIELWTHQPQKLKEIRTMLQDVGDMERRLGKISSPSASPRDLHALAVSAKKACEVLVASGLAEKWPHDLSKMLGIAQKLEASLVEEPPVTKFEGRIIQKGIDSKLDELIDLSTDGRSKILDLELKEKESTGISSLKVRFNSVFGYYIEITNTHKDKVPTRYLRKQTLVNAERYITDELQELERKLLSADSQRQALETQLFEELRKETLDSASTLLRMAGRVAGLDVHTALAWLALEKSLVKPHLTDESSYIKIEGSRHLVVEAISHKRFVSNDIYLDFGGCLLLTGPNMAGKSTLMRQVVLTALLAQIGSFVPATKAQLPIFDSFYTRIGANDAVGEGLSTFMMEMTETAEILRGATKNSLIVLDEIGRGTSTYDGMSLAQALLEYLLTKTGGYVFFATHYHELTRLADKFSSIKNAHMSIREKNGELQFLYVLQEGAANRSYGIEVAKLAGIPDSVIKRARSVLKELESQNQMSLLDWSSSDKSNDRHSHEVELSAQDSLREEISAIDINQISPMEALQKLYHLQQQTKNSTRVQ